MATPVSIPTADDASATQRLFASSPARISVALCTYQGGRYIEAQLHSLLEQSLPPSELVVCDDGSTDDTLAILERFRQQAPFPVRIERNPTRLGSTKNFEKAIGLCTGDLIATCDQDDVWLPEKLAANRAAFDAVPAPALVFSDADVVDEALHPLGHTMWDSIHFGPFDRWRVRRGKSFEVLLKQWLVTGATMVFRADLRPWLLPIPENWVHDGWIALMAGALAPVGLIPLPLVKYRQHAAQQIGGRKLGWRELYQRARELGPPAYRLAHDRFVLARERLGSMGGHMRDPAYLSLMDGKVAHQKRRVDILQCRSRLRRIGATLCEVACGRYWRYSPNWRHVLKDMFL